MAISQAQPVPIVYLIDKIGTGGVASHLRQVLLHMDRGRFAPTVVCLVGKEARAYDPEGHDRMVAAYRALGAPVEILTLERIYDPRYLGQYWRLWRLLGQIRPAIFHMYLFSSTLAGTLAGALRRLPCMVASRRESGSWWMSPRHHAALSWAHRFHRAVVVNSSEIGREVREIEGVPEAKIHTIWNGVDLPKLEEEMARARSGGSPLDGEGPVVGMVGNLVPVKGHRTFLAAASKVAREMPTTRFVLVGDGPLREELAGMVSREGLEGRVRFVGREPAARWLPFFDIAVQCSVSEGGSNVVLEYMAAGLPMAVTAVGANVDMLEDGRTACLAPAEDSDAMAGSILALLRDPDTAAAMGRAARETCLSHYTAEAMVRRMEALYAELLGETA